MAEILFSGNYIDRCGELRAQPEPLAVARRDPATRFLPVWQGKGLIQNERAALLARAAVEAYHPDSDRSIFLGRIDGMAVFGLDVTDADAANTEASAAAPDFGSDCEFVGLRDISSRLPATEAALVAYAKAMVTWQDRHRHCGVCGARSRAAEAGFVMECSDDACGHRSFPRLDPAIIVLVQDGERCLLGRQATWPEGRFSTIAGFVEPGESFEDAVRREVKEETNVDVSASRYLASQPWPFPAALMVGFHATAASTDIACNDQELAEARWVSRDDMVCGTVILPPRISIAYYLVAAWFDQYDGPALASLDLPAAPAPATVTPAITAPTLESLKFFR